MYFMQSDGSGVTRIAGSTAVDEAPQASADGRSIVFSSMRGMVDIHVFIINRDGTGFAQLTDDGGFQDGPRFSPDGRTIALDFPSLDGRDVWTLDRATSTLSRVTSDHDAHDPVWTRDGRDLYYTSIRRGNAFGIYRTRPGSGVTTKITVDPRLAFTGVPMPDGKSLIAQAVDFRPGSRNDVVRIDSAGRITPIVADSYDEGYSEVSPDGRWLAYDSNETGTTEIYVRSFPNPQEKHRISVSGGTAAQWSRDGRELLFWTSDMTASYTGGSVFTVDVQTSPTFKAGTPRLLFSPRQDLLGITATADLKRFLAAVPVQGSPPPSITVMMNWQAVKP
jgi:Tol biopolymer transport system component